MLKTKFPNHNRCCIEINQRVWLKFEALLMYTRMFVSICLKLCVGTKRQDEDLRYFGIIQALPFLITL